MASSMAKLIDLSILHPWWRLVEAKNKIQATVFNFIFIQFNFEIDWDSWQSASDFTQPAFSCPVASNILTGAETLPRTTEENEDCLYLKIIAPTSAFDGDEKKKVIVWIHGGTFNFGGMDVQYEDPTPLVEEQDIIVRVFIYDL